MSIITSHNESNFGVGDVVRVHMKVTEGPSNASASDGQGKSRIQVFEGTVIGIKGRDTGKSFTVRRIGAQKIGIEMIFPLLSPTVDKVEVVRKGVEGVRRAKLYYIRGKSNREIEKIYSRAAGKNKKPVEMKSSKAGSASGRKKIVAKKKAASKRKSSLKK